MTNRIWFFVLLVFSLHVNAQSKYKEGVLVTAAGDTLKGFIDYRAWYHNPESILFKTSGDVKDPQQFTIANTSWFSIPGYASYAAFVVSVSSNAIDFGSLAVDVDTTQVTKGIFLKEILHGDRVKLYSYQDKVKKRFYILSDRQRTPSELTYSKVLRNLQEFEYSTYKQQLRTLAVEYNVLTEDLDGKIQSSEYKEEKLKAIVKQLNTQKEERLAQHIKKNRRFGYFVNVGINKSKLTYMGRSLVTVDRVNSDGVENFKDEVTTESVQPVVSGGIDFYTNPIIRRFIIRLELSAGKIESKTKSYSQYNHINSAGTENTYRLAGWNISITPQIIYNFYSTNTINCYLGGGASLSVLRFNDNTVEQKRIDQSATGVWVQEDYFLLKSSNLSTILRCGLQLHQRFDCSVMWGNQTKYTTANTGGQSIKSGLFVFSVGYLMNRSK
jgi:hypothetical protein